MRYHVIRFQHRTTGERRTVVAPIRLSPSAAYGAARRCLIANGDMPWEWQWIDPATDAPGGPDVAR